jgi:hypothetical protein
LRNGRKTPAAGNNLGNIALWAKVAKTFAITSLVGSEFNPTGIDARGACHRAGFSWHSSGLVSPKITFDQIQHGPGVVISVQIKQIATKNFDCPSENNVIVALLFKVRAWAQEPGGARPYGSKAIFKKSFPSGRFLY